MHKALGFNMTCESKEWNEQQLSNATSAHIMLSEKIRMD